MAISIYFIPKITAKDPVKRQSMYSTGARRGDFSGAESNFSGVESNMSAISAEFENTSSIFEKKKSSRSFNRPGLSRSHSFSAAGASNISLLDISGPGENSNICRRCAANEEEMRKLDEKESYEQLCNPDRQESDLARKQDEAKDNLLNRLLAMKKENNELRETACNPGRQAATCLPKQDEAKDSLLSRLIAMKKENNELRETVEKFRRKEPTSDECTPEESECGCSPEVTV